jgi:2-polyprenyl-3-methyl-5-hydroxy-6-metoxy-1,4-benzoquinol methylase
VPVGGPFSQREADRSGGGNAPAEFRDASLPIIPVERVDTCAVCGTGNFEVVARGYDYELRTCRNEWTFVKCAHCGHVWLNPRPAVTTLETIYPRHYYAYDYEKKISRVARSAKAWLDARKFNGILEHAPRPPQSFLDIGCGSGRYLRAMHKRGIDRKRIHGLELDAAVVASLRGEGFNVECARVEDAEFTPRSIDMVTMFHVIEHVDAPDRVVSRIAGWMPPGGLLAIETPNLDSLDQRLFTDGLWGGYHIPRHWHLFTPPTLQRLLRSAGFVPRATLYQTGHSFWMYSFHHRLRYAERPRIALSRFFDPFSSVVPLAAFTGFDLARSALGARTSAMLMIAERAP